MSITQDQIESAIKEYIDPYLENDLVTAKVIKDIKIDGDKVNVDVVMGFPIGRYKDKLVSSIGERVSKVEGVSKATINVSSKISSHVVKKGVEHITGVKNIIAIASGKGGVGKSTTSANLALALVAEGATVGILDADIYGPSQPRMMGSTAKPESKDGKTLEPIMAHGVQTMSIGYLIEDETPMIWRGPMVTQALEQLLNDTQWNDVDYLIIDLPPGTGDTQLTLAQKVPVSGAVIVTTPQERALLDARKGLKMFEKVEVPVLGIVENMSIHICSECGHEEYIFGSGGGESMSEQFDVDLLGSFPLDIKIREHADAGQPTVAADPEGRVAEIYGDIARRITAKLSTRTKDFSASFPKIVIQNN